MEQGTQGQGEPLFSCRIDNAKVVTATLTCLSNGSKKDQLAQVEVNEDGIVFIVTGRAKFTQSQGTINRSLFQAFQCQPQGGRFTVDLNLLLECLQVFGAASLASTMLTMSYEPNQAVLRLTLEEQGVLTTCDIHAIEEGEDALDLAALASAFRSSPEVLRAILKSEVLKEAISDLSDLPGAGSVRVAVAPQEPHFHLTAGGVYGALEIFLPRSSEAFVHFDCSEARAWSYGLGALNQGMRALTVAKETYMRINEEGILCVQHQVENTASGHSTFIDFLCLAEETGEEEQREQEEREEKEEEKGGESDAESMGGVQQGGGGFE